MDIEKLGYVLAKTESLEKQVSSLEYKLDNISDKLDGLKTDISVYNTVVKVTKVGVGVLVCILTFKFGDISSLWRS